MKIQAFEFNLFGVNTYVVWDTATSCAAVIDPGMVSEKECQRFDDFIAENGLRLERMILTHMHIDHTYGVEHIKWRYGLGTLAHPADAFLGEQLPGQARMFHLPMVPDPLTIDVPLTDGEHLAIGEGELVVIEVPGHSPGSVALYDPQGAFVVTGDALFHGSVGRTDLPGGSMPTLVNSIRTRLLTLPPQTIVYPGHGPSTTIGAELRSNPFL